jgi:hypothetical protein
VRHSGNRLRERSVTELYAMLRQGWRMWRSFCRLDNEIMYQLHHLDPHARVRRRAPCLIAWSVFLMLMIGINSLYVIDNNQLNLFISKIDGTQLSLW